MVRHASPYLGTDQRWKPKGTLGLINRAFTIAKEELKESSAGYKERVVLEVLSALEVPVLRRTLQAILVFDHSFHPGAVTSTLDALREGGRIKRFRFAFEHVNDAYCIRGIGRIERKRYIDFLSVLYAEREVVLNRPRLGDSAQIFVREMLLQSGRFEDVTAVERLGKIRLPRVSGQLYEPHELDLNATEIATRFTFGISVKNENEWIFPGNTAIRDAYTKAKAHGVRPWLIGAFVTEEAKARCNRDHIRIDGMNAQILPSEYDPEDNFSLCGSKRMSSTLTRLRAVLGPEPFILIPQRFRNEHFERYRSSIRFDSPKAHCKG